MKVQNNFVIRRTAWQYIFKNRGKSLVIILSVALCTFLFTTLFTAGGNILSELKKQMQRQIGTTSMGSFKYLNQQEYDSLLSDKKIKEVSHWIIIGEAVNPELVKLRTEVHWADKVSAKKGFSLPQAGHLPETEDEAAFSSLVLQAFNLKSNASDYESLLGQKVTLLIDTKDDVIEKTFTVCGVFTGDRVSMAQTVLVSKAFQEKYAPVPEQSYYANTSGEKKIMGTISADVDFAFPFNINGQLMEAAERNGIPLNVELGVSNANAFSSMDMGTLLLIAFLLLTIFFSGYLIINNIYRINIYSDIRTYGLLKTIGMSGRQLSKLVKWEALFLSIPGIILGILGGSFVGTILVPVIAKILDAYSINEKHMQVNALVPLLSAAFSLLTVFVSCRRPARMASKVSPIEAVKYSEVPTVGAKQKTSVGKNRRYSTLSFALKNINRDKRKVFWVVLSLSLSLVILNSIYTMLHSFSEDKFVEEKIATDFSVSDASVDNPGIQYESKNLSGVSDTFLNAVETKTGIEGIGSIYIESSIQYFTEEDFNKIDERLFCSKRFESIYSYGEDTLVKDMYREYREALVLIYGADQFILNNIPVIQGKIDMEKFLSGKYILVNEYNMRLSDDEKSMPFFLPGEKISVQNNEGKVKTYEVMATVEIPYAFRLQQYTDLDMYYILPPEEFKNFFGERNPMRTLFNVSDEFEEDIESWMEEYTNEVDPMLTYTSRKIFKQEFKSFTGMIVIVGGLLTTILALIGLLNLTNTMITSILSRKLELAMLEAVGMTKKTQIQGMCAEGILYALFTGVAGIILSAIFSVLLVKPFGLEMYYFVWKFSLLPVMVVFPIMILIATILPVIIYKATMKNSIVERLRMSEGA